MCQKWRVTAAILLAGVACVYDQDAWLTCNVQREMHSSRAPCCCMLMQFPEHNAVLTSPEWDDIVGQQSNGNGTANHFLNVSTDDGNLHAEPHEVSWQLWVLLPAMLRQIQASCYAKAGA